MSVENAIYAKVWGLAVNDEDGNPDYGYVKVKGLSLGKEHLAHFLDRNPDDVILITAEEYRKGTDGDDGTV